MNNLKLSSEVSLKLELNLGEEETVHLSAFDIERSRLFFASSSNRIYTTHLSSFHNEPAWSKTFLPAEVDSVELEPSDYVTALEYLMEKEALIIGTGGGLMLLHSVDGRGTEVVGRVEGGIRCIAPSPDGDLLAVTNGLGQVLVMTHDWDLLYETALEAAPEDFDVREPTFSSKCDGTVTWRGDGKYFATLSEVCGSPTFLKRIKVWERDSGELHAASESKAFMGSVLEWMPSGAKIAAVYDRKADNECPSIAFFERNGLERSSFSINEQQDAAIEILRWNCTSDLLAAIVRCEKYDAVKIWFFSNNHWYLKNEIRYTKQDGVRFMWDPTKPLQLICWTLGGHIMIYNFIWNTAVMENSTALVIDGSNILITPLSLYLMPPPMYLFNLKFPSAVRGMSLYSKNSKNCLAAFLSDGCLCVAELPSLDNWEELEGRQFIVEASVSKSVFGSCMDLLWLDSHILVAVLHYGSSQYMSRTLSNEDGLLGFYAQEIELECAENRVPALPTCSGWHAKILHENALGPFIGIGPNPTKRCSAFIQVEGGKIFEYTSRLGPLKRDDLSFSSSCPQMSVVSVGDSGSLKPLSCGLDDLGRLHVGGKILCNNCSSFAFYSNLADEVITHLILSTKQDLLCIVGVDDIFYGELDKYEDFIPPASRRREENKNFIHIWERGAKIVGVLHGDEAAVILQTTRGNLECIYPRKLVLASIVNALVQGRFKDALHMVRRHRIDFNVIVDHSGWEAFAQSAAEFVRQVNNLSYITEFVCAIKSENVAEQLYKDFISLPCSKENRDMQATDSKGLGANNKVSSVLLAIRKALEEQLPESPARELCILTTLARSGPPALEEALKRIKVTREMELSSSNKPRRMSYPSAEEALKHLLWLSDADAVFEAALGLYDLNLAAIVALNSQRDPKEFLPFLQELEHMPVLLMRYNIDLRLRRFAKALKHIVSAGDAHYEDSMNLMRKNPQLFPSGLQLITDPPKRREVLEAWGDHLSDAKCFEDAATTYLCSSSLEKALKSYRACGNWSGVLTVAGLLKMGKDEIVQLAHELSEELQALGKPGDAAKIALDYCGDVNAGVNLLISARIWEEALRVAFLHMREDLICEVKNASLECASTLIDEYEEGLEKVGKYLARYLGVRQRRLLLAAKVQSEERSMSDLDNDTASETSSNFSGMSAYTTGTRKSTASTVVSSATSKARDMRRQRKRGKIRPGSADEEMALVEHLKGMSLTAGAKQELKSLLGSLVMLGEEETARKLQRAGENFQVSQMAAVQLAEDTISSDNIDENAHTLEHYIAKGGTELQNSEAFFWRSRVFLSP